MGWLVVIHKGASHHPFHLTRVVPDACKFSSPPQAFKATKQTSQVLTGSALRTSCFSSWWHAQPSNTNATHYRFH